MIVPIAVSPNKLKIAEFGIAIQAPTGSNFNFVELNGTVGVQTADITTSPVITLIVSRRLASVSGSEKIIFTTTQTITGASQQETITFNCVDGGVDGIIASGAYGYALYVQRSILLVEPANPPFVHGPINFTGTSYVRGT